MVLIWIQTNEQHINNRIINNIVNYADQISSLFFSNIIL